MERDSLFDSDIGETYGILDQDMAVPLPLTRKGFESLLAALSAAYGVPADDRCRQVLAGYIHHIPNEEDSAVFGVLGRMLRKSVANSTSWKIDQEIKMKERAEAVAQSQKKEEATPLALVSPDGQTTPGA